MENDSSGLEGVRKTYQHTWFGFNGASDGQLDCQDGVAVTVADPVAPTVEGAHVVDDGRDRARELAGGRSAHNQAGSRSGGVSNRDVCLLLLCGVSSVASLVGVRRRGGKLLSRGLRQARGSPQVLRQRAMLRGRGGRLRRCGILLLLLMLLLRWRGILRLLLRRRGVLVLLLRRRGVVLLLLLVLRRGLVRRRRRGWRRSRGRAGLRRRSIGPALGGGRRRGCVLELRLRRRRRRGRRRIALLSYLVHGTRQHLYRLPIRFCIHIHVWTIQDQRGCEVRTYLRGQRHQLRGVLKGQAD